MNTRLFAIRLALLIPAAVPGSLMAQEKIKENEAEKPKESQEIIIRKKVDKEEKMTIVVDGKNITINGKPMAEYKDGEIIIRKRNLEDLEESDLFDEPMMKHPMPRMSPPGVMAMPREFYFHMDDDMDNDKGGPLLGVISKDNAKGAEIAEIMEGSAAEKAGLKAGDIITGVNDKKVNNPQSLMDAVKSFKPNDEVKVSYLRDGKSNTLNAKLGEKKHSQTKIFNYRVPGPGNELLPPNPPGDGNMMWKYEMEDDRPQLGLKIQDAVNGDGVNVLDVNSGSPADRAGIKKDDKIVEVDGKAVKNTDGVKAAVDGAREKSGYPVKVMRNGAPVKIDLKIPKKLKTTDL